MLVVALAVVVVALAVVALGVVVVARFSGSGCSSRFSGSSCRSLALEAAAAVVVLV